MSQDINYLRPADLRRMQRSFKGNLREVRVQSVVDPVATIQRGLTEPHRSVINDPTKVSAVTEDENAIIACSTKEFCVAKESHMRSKDLVTFTTDLNDPDVILKDRIETQLMIKEKILTIVFWDIKGFSILCHLLKTYSTLLISFLKEFFEMAREVIFEYGGVLDKFIGDGVMALFGLQSENNIYSHDAICAVRAALELRERFKWLQKKWTAIWEKHVPYKITIDLKCGINTGYAIVSNVGTVNTTQFTAIGITVNIANRLSNISDNGQIIVSSTTKSKIINQFELKSLGIVDVLKNIPGPFEIFSVKKKKSKNIT